MEEKNKKDIVEQIIEKMKTMEELPYKEGAWENFQSRYGTAPTKRNKTFYWAACAAAVLLLGVVTVKNWPETNQGLVENQVVANHQESENRGSSDNSNVTQPEGTSDSPELANIDLNSQPNPTAFESLAAGNSIQRNEQQDVVSYSSFGDLKVLSNHSNQNLYPSSVQVPNRLTAYNFNIDQPSIRMDEEDYSVLRQTNMNTELAYQNEGAKKGVEPVLKNRNFNLREKFDLGLFVSPNSTNDRFNFGGGVLLAYNISKNISVRTGLAYNKYDVSEMKDPVANAETAVVANKDAIHKITGNGLTQNYMSSNAIILPNVNAISGNVQALEIPLDVRVKSKSGYYASSGITYAAVFNQNRYAHFVENANSELFGNGLPENEADVKTAVKQVSRAIKTEDENVSSKGFGGFVNFSIGKEMKMNKNINLSVEPFVKLPVGSFKRADMNYTNGGIRIITNF